MDFLNKGKEGEYHLFRKFEDQIFVTHSTSNTPPTLYRVHFKNLDEKATTK